MPQDAETNTPHKIFILDENPLMREGLATIIEKQEDLEVCGKSGNPHAAEREISNLDPDIVIADLSFQSASGLGLIKNLKTNNADTQILVLSRENEAYYAERALRAGANGYIMKFEPAEKVLAAVYEVLEGKLHLSFDLMEMFARRFVGGETFADNTLVEKLSAREFEVFSLLGQGFKTRAIAEELHLSIKTVQAYCSRIKEKLELSGARELLQHAIHWHESTKANRAANTDRANRERQRRTKSAVH